MLKIIAEFFVAAFILLFAIAGFGVFGDYAADLPKEIVE